MKLLLCLVCLLSLVSCTSLTDLKHIEIAEKLCQQNGGISAVNIHSGIDTYPLSIWCVNGAKFDATLSGSVYRDFTKKPLTTPIE